MSESGQRQPSAPLDPADPGPAGQELVQGLLDEQSRSWRRGEGVPVEAYRERHPALQADVEGLLDLIYHEVVLRQQRGEAPRLEEYRARFPQHQDQLRKLFDLHGVLEAAHLVDRDDAGVLQLAADPRLFEEAAHEVRVALVVLQQHLDRQLTAQGQVAAPQHGPHAAAADLAQ